MVDLLESKQEGRFFSIKPAISQKQKKIGTRLLLIDRKLHTRFRLVRSQRPWMNLKGHCALCFKIYAFSVPILRTFE